MRRPRRLAALFLCVPLCACFRLGPDRLERDQIGFSRALTDSEKQQTLLNVVRLRYADMPTFLDATQVISGYQLQRSVSGSVEVFPNASAGSFLGGTGAAQLQESPTFTFQPVTGDHFAQSFLRPLSPATLLPLVQGGLPVDVLFRLAVQSAGPLENSTGLEQGGGQGSPGFFLLLRDLRSLQVAGLLGIRIEQVKVVGPDGKPTAGPERVFMTFAPARTEALAIALAEARRLLGLPDGASDAEIVYGRAPQRRGRIALLTRSMLGALGQLAFQVEVPDADVASRRTLATVGQAGIERRPVVTIHSGTDKPAGAFTAIDYNGRWFWIDEDDFDSKLAFTMVNILLALAKTSSAPGTVITIPAG